MHLFTGKAFGTTGRRIANPPQVINLPHIALLLAVSAAHAAPQTCARCHTAETASFAQSGMTHALESAKDGAILRANPKMSVTRDGYTWEIARAGDETIYTVTDGNTTYRARLDWAFGLGAAGQTYLFERDGYWY